MTEDGDGGAYVKGRGELRSGLLSIARTLEENCLKLLTEISHTRAQGKEAIAEATALDKEKGEAARNQLKLALDGAEEPSRTKIREAYLEASKLIYAMAAARERQREIDKRVEFEGKHLDMLQKAIVNLNALVRDLDGGAIDPNTVGTNEIIQMDRELEKSILMAQEDEKRRISIVIHDGPAQLLANLIMRVDFCSRLMSKKPEEAAGELVSLRKEMQDLLDDVRRLIFELRPMTLDDLGFLPTLQRFVENMKPTLPFDLQLVIRGQPDEPPKLTAIVLYRAIQEGILNISKHASATRGWIRLKAVDDDKLSLVIEDDGRGFDTATLGQMVAMGRLGLHSVQKRVELVDGKFEMTSEQGKGTSITVTVPMRRIS